MALYGHRNSNWKGGRLLSYKGYMLVRSPNHPREHRGYVFEHIIIAEKALGKLLPEGAVVHHANGTKKGPLVICQNEAYHKLLHRRMRALRTCGHANWLKCCRCHHYDEPAKLYVYYPPPGAKSSGMYARHESCNNEYLRKRRERIKKQKERR